MKRIILAETGSTNDYALGLLDAQRPEEGTLVQALRQTRGRGQRGARWEAEAGTSLTASLVVYPAFLEPSRLFALSEAVSLAVADCVDAACGARSAIKWPNDLLLGSRKVAGLLIESRLRGGRVDAAVAGIGLNVNQLSFPRELPNAGSLRMHIGRPLDLEEIVASLHVRLLVRYRELAEDPGAVERGYLARLYGAGRTLSFRTAGRRFSGAIRGIDAAGRLQVAEPGAEPRAYEAKEIAFEVDPAFP